MFVSPASTTGARGVATGALVTTLSTRIERAPVIAFQPFSLLFEADAGHGEWRPVARVDGLNANTVVSASASRLVVFPPNQAVCPGTPIDFEVQARTIPDAPRPGAAAGRYAELRYTDGSILAATPRPAWSSWRTDGAGVIRFSYTPSRVDQSRLVEAWVDGQPIGSSHQCCDPRTSADRDVGRLNRFRSQIGVPIIQKPSPTAPRPPPSSQNRSSAIGPGSPR
jgi:hypothetical protein